MCEKSTSAVASLPPSCSRVSAGSWSRPRHREMSSTADSSRIYTVQQREQEGGYEHAGEPWCRAQRVHAFAGPAATPSSLTREQCVPPLPLRYSTGTPTTTPDPPSAPTCSLGSAVSTSTRSQYSTLHRSSRGSSTPSPPAPRGPRLPHAGSPGSAARSACRRPTRTAAAAPRGTAPAPAAVQRHSKSREELICLRGNARFSCWQ